MTRPATAPLSQDDIDRLETLLWEKAAPNGGMPLEMLDGFFSALICSPELTMPSEYNRLVWGDPPPVWDTLSEGSDAFYLLQGYWNHVVDRINLDPDEAQEASAPPIMMPDPLLEHFDELVESGELPPGLDEEMHTFPLASGWAVGFFLAIELHEASWDRWAETYEHVDEHLGDIQHLMRVAGLEEEEEPDPDADDELSEPPSLLERLDIMFDLPHMLRAFHMLRLAETIRAQGPAKREAKPERNDPCPCGSGKKYKKCHGDPAKLN